MKKNIIVGVTGGIAAYKTCDIVSRLKKQGFEVDVIMTKHAQEFVSPLTFQTLSQNKVVTDMFSEPTRWDVEHIELAKKAELFLIAPATANIIGKLANGIADDMLSTTVMATRAEVILAPAMNTAMYENPVVQENIEKLKKRGYLFIDPASGLLACGDVGAGKMEEPEIIVEVLTLRAKVS
ncbi:MAG: bifunctional phosphopantothenoylcysteine decarboxylase/phosphopantothenate--cysteine ligase CoaBC, partial [Filifactor alocis]|nr:bifunctional phosphopantothenoylcysteine decarboxylase/phosphopantothenate--cysteine ligase CoaBC [Filifactor alocis]